MGRMGVVALFFAMVLAGGVASGQVTVKKDGTGDYTGIQQAIDDINRTAQEIVVYPGVYSENILIAGDVHLRAQYGPLLTAIDGSSHQGGRQDTIDINSGLTNVQIMGFYITGGQNGITINTSTSALIANCTLHANDIYGVYVHSANGTDVVELRLFNNVLLENQSGLFFADDTGAIYLGPSDIRNNVFMSNRDWGITFDNGSVGNPQNLTLGYNCFFNNVSGAVDTRVNYSYGTGVGGIQLNPLFLNQSPGPGKDVRLRRSPEMSPCVNTGHPATTSNDPDGTRNDIGAFGGPYCASFYESPPDGPIVRNLTVTPATVPAGTVFTVQATVAVR